MKRSKRGIDWVAGLVGLGVPGLLLLGVFSTMPYAPMAGEWPFGISSTEVEQYQRWFDRRGDPADSAAHAEHFVLDGPRIDLPDARWHAFSFRADELTCPVDVRYLRTARGGLVIRFPRDTLFRGQRQIVLLPAAVASIRSKYEEVLATELGLLAPEVTFVELSAPEHHGTYLKEERIDAGFLEKHRITDGALFTQGFAAGRPDHLFPEVDGDTSVAPIIADIERKVSEGADPLHYIDRDEAAGYLMMLSIADRADLLLDEGLFAYRWTTGRITPLYRARRDRSAEIAHRPRSPVLFQRLLQDPAFLDHLRDRKIKLEENIWRLKERFSALDQAWLPVLARGGSIYLAQAQADRIKEDLIARIRYLDVPAFLTTQPPAPLPVPFNDQGAGALADPLSRAEAAALLQGEWNGDSLVLRRGKRVITGDLVLPPGAALILEKSVRIEIAPGRSVLVQGPLIVRGTGVNPVFIRPLREDSAFGAFAVSLNGKGRCDLHGLRISGGGEGRINGRYHSGMLSIHGAGSVLMENCSVSGSRGEDALNIKHGSVVIRDCVFEDGHADLVDLDFVKGSVNGCTFRNGRDDSNGDGLDVSGSHVHVDDCRFSDLRDKGLSVGEVSEVLVTGCEFSGNTLGVATKDLSIAYVDGCTFTGNGTVIAAYRKKQIYGGARLFLYGNTFIDNLRDREVDALSAVIQKDALEERVKLSFGLQR